MELQGRLKELQDKGLGLAAISYDPPETLADFSSRRGITFPLLSDAGSATIARYGLLNPLPEEAQGPNKDDPAVKAEVQKYVSVVRPNAAMIGIAFPGTFILDRRGYVTSRFFEDFYIERNTVSNLMMKVGGKASSVAATKVATAHLDLTTYPSDAAVAPGNRFSLALAVVPHARIHIYAPGATGYRIVGITITPQPFVRVLPMPFPKPETYFFKPLNERVPVYQKPFTLVQELILEGTPAAQAALRGKDALTLSGALEYQACDDKVCFNPTSVPLFWTLTLRPLVTERPAKPPQEQHPYAFTLPRDEGQVSDVLLRALSLGQLRLQAPEESLHHHLRHAADQSLTDARDRTGRMHVGRHVDAGGPAFRTERNHRRSLHGAGASLAFNDEFVGRLRHHVRQLDGARVRARDGRETDGERDGVAIVARRLELVAAGNAGRQNGGVHQQGPHAIGRGVERVRA